MAKKRRRIQPKFFLFVTILLALVAGVIVVANKLGADGGKTEAVTGTPTPAPAGQTSATPTPAPLLPGGLLVRAAQEADPALFGFSAELMINGDEVSTYAREEKVSFPDAASYTDVAGILTFGGNNYRNTFSYGAASINERLLSSLWEQPVGGIDSWSGTGWTGQPLIIQWPDAVRPWLGVSETYKTKQGFTEVICPAMDGKIYFFELETGAKTRDPINVGVVMKCTPCLDPNGWPILYVGQSIQSQNEKGLNVGYIYAYSLVTNEQIARFGGHDYFSHREWQAYDGSPLIVDDTLIYAGENGVLYSSRLHTDFDTGTGIVTLEPERLSKYRYSGTGYSESNAADSRWYGVESSVAGFQEYVFFTDNGGRLQCVNINTLALQYVADVNDDADASVVIDESFDDNTAYLYTASQVSRRSGTIDGAYGYSYHRCFDGLTGRLVWEQKWIASTGDENSSGGTLATPQIGRGNISDLVIYSMNLTALTSITSATASPAPEGTPAGDGAAATDTPQAGASSYTLGGRIVAYNKHTGDIVWTIEKTADYWSSPVLVYDEAGKAYLIQCDRNGYVTLYDAQTSSELFTLDLGSRIDSTPAVFNNLLVVGTRGKGGSGGAAKIVCVKIN